MKKNKVYKNFLEELERTPIISIACEKSNISRNTFYRWMKEDKNFSLLANESLKRGIDLVNDVAESNILNGIKNQDRKSTEYWLSHRHPVYKKQNYYHKEDTRALDKKNHEQKIEEARRRMTEFQDKWFKKGK